MHPGTLFIYPNRNTVYQPLNEPGNCELTSKTQHVCYNVTKDMNDNALVPLFPDSTIVKCNYSEIRLTCCSL